MRLKRFGKISEDQESKRILIFMGKLGTGGYIRFLVCILNIH